jgi:hypothetical protein
MKCPSCHLEVQQDFFYCPYCRKELREKPVDAGAWAQIKLYLISVLIPPFGLPLTFKYLKSPDEKTKIVGWVSLFLTAAALAVATVWSINQINKMTEEVNKQLNGYGNLL